MHQLLRIVVLVMALNAAGCAMFESPEWARRHAPVQPVSKAPAEQPPIVSDRFMLSPSGNMDGDVVGEVQVGAAPAGAGTITVEATERILSRETMNGL